jgi:PTS system nitrogen regulatory IIA component
VVEVIDVVEEDFDVDSLAKYLHLAPEIVRKMAERGKIPGRRVGGDWRFAPAEIHHWFEDRIGISDENELIEMQRVFEGHAKFKAEQDYKISELLSVERIAKPLFARTKNSVIEQMCELSAQSGALWQPTEMAEALRNREQLHPTALENGVALLHPRRPKPDLFGEPFVALGVTMSGIPFGGPRGCMTDVFFLIASTTDAFHLKLLAQLSRLIQQADFLERLRAAEDPLDAWQVIVDTEKQFD